MKPVLVVAGRERELRPTFAALVAAEEELGPLFALVERASAGQLRLSELAALFWHCLDEVTREEVGEAVAAAGLAHCAGPLRALLGYILRGSSMPERAGMSRADLEALMERDDG